MEASRTMVQWNFLILKLYGTLLYYGSMGPCHNTAPWNSQNSKIRFSNQNHIKYFDEFNYRPKALMTSLFIIMEFFGVLFVPLNTFLRKFWGRFAL